jgi:hypothetical protein
MTRAQRVALAAPCLFAFETAHRRYGWVVRPGATLVLTVNAGYE